MAKILEARWMGPAPVRKDGPQRQEFQRGVWTQVTSEAADYFRQFRAWEVRERVVVRKRRRATKPRAARKITRKPTARKKPVPEVVVSEANESSLGGSAIEEEPSDGGFVAVPVDREEGSRSEPVTGEVI